MEKNQKKLIFFMPSMEGGGVEKNLIIVANYVSKYIDCVNLITFDDTFNTYFKKKINIINVKTKTKTKYSKYYKYIQCLWLLFKEYLVNKNILVFTFQANIYVIILSYFFNFKIISRSNSSPSGWSKNFLKNYIFKFFIKKANSIVVNSMEFKKEFKKKFLINTTLIYNPLNKNEVIKRSKLNKKKINLFFKSNDLRIINIARLTDQKDHLTILKALKLIIKKLNLKMLIIGYGNQKNNLEKSILNYNLKKYVKIIDNRSNPFPYLKNSDLFILSSKYEGLPNVILEAQALKKYVISTNCPTGPKEILMNGKLGGLFKVGDYKKLASMILSYSRNKKGYEAQIDLAYKYLDRFDYELNCKKYLFLIKKYL